MPPYRDVPANRLVTVQAGVQLLDTTAAGFLAARDTYAEEEHRNLTIALPAGGYRSHAMDLDMHAHPGRYNINPAIGLLPVDWSVHRTGQCVDIANGLAWMIANGHRWNFSRPIRVDVNHFQHDGTAVAAAHATPITAVQEYLTKAGRHMMYLGNLGNGQVAAIPEGGTPYIFKDPADYNDWRTVVQAYNNMPGIPAQNLLAVPPVLDRTKLLFVSGDRFVKATAVQG